MKREFREVLKEGFAAPDPERKQAFFKNLELERVRGVDFLVSQAGYIRKWVWGLSALVFAVAVLGAQVLQRNMIWCISAFMPLLAMALITETGRSQAYGMAEFELSTRFSLRSVVLARLCILGAADLLLICLLIPLVGIDKGAGFFQTGVYLFCPYLLTAFSGLWVMRRVRSRDALYLCAGISAGVSMGNLLLYTRCVWLFAEQNFIWWLAVLVLLGAGTGNQSYKTIKQTEELAWN